jgi:hypothetical protein
VLSQKTSSKLPPVKRVALLYGQRPLNNETSEKVYEKFILKVAVSQKTLVAVTELVEAFLLSLFLR